ncbi:hypothetical protein [Streptomyces endophytica]|uniref:Uncharacterized protein n=1 Tax=Streptomyces endophytica TaxID=2991496 RepID=A0ABY6P9S8_9ACTN|nr:hypothetical protein [Streptomyces endophytica]UZJ30363.1 hypothetical protein OJ254_08235 [Streptomyces endophytica]
MQAESAVEIVRASLALAFPTATEEGLTRAAELVLRWGSEGVGFSWSLIWRSGCCST